MWGIVVALALAAQAPEPARLVYAPGKFVDRCPSRDDVAARIEALLQSEVFAEPATRIVVVVLEDDAGPPADAGTADPIRARVELLDMDFQLQGARVIEAPGEGCEQLVGAAALAASIALDPARALLLVEEPPPPPPPPPPPRPPPEPTFEVRRDPPPPPPVADDRIVLLGGAGVRTAFVQNRAVAEPGVTVAAGLRWRWASLRAEADLGGAVGGAGPAAVTGTVLYRVAPCAHVVVVTGCALFTGGGLGSIGGGFPPQAYFGTGLRGGLDWPLGAYGAARAYGDVELAPFTPTPGFGSIVVGRVGLQLEAPLP